MRNKFFLNSTLSTSKFQSHEANYNGYFGMSHSGTKNSGPNVDKLEISPLLNKSISCFDTIN